MLPIVGVPKMVRQGLVPSRPLFCREAGFEHVGRYITGLLLSPNKTLQGIYATQVWPEKKPSRRAMHEAVFEAEWNAEELLPRHRALIAPEHRNRGREVISLDWTLVHHERGPHIYQGNCASSGGKPEELGQVGQMPASAFPFDFQGTLPGIAP